MSAASYPRLAEKRVLVRIKVTLTHLATIKND